RKGPRRLDAESCVLLAHGLREAELGWSGVNEIYGRLSLSFPQLNHRGLSLTPRLVRIDQPRQLPYSRIPKEIFHAETQLMPLAHLADQPDDHQRIATQGERVVVHAHPFDAQQLPPELRQ